MSFIINLSASAISLFALYSNMVALPNLTKEGYRILSYRLKDYNPSHIMFGDGVKVTVY